MKTAKRLWLALPAALLSLLLLVPSALALDVNKASAEELQSLKGIGPKRAQAIVEYRKTNGPFQSIEGLLNVPGVGQSIIEDNAGQLDLDKSTVASSSK